MTLGFSVSIGTETKIESQLKPKRPKETPQSHFETEIDTCAAQATITGAQSDLRSPGDVAHGLRQPLQPGSQGLADPGGVAISPGRLNERPPGAPVAGPGEAFPPDRISGGALRWNKTDKRRGVSKRRTSPISATKVTATRNEAPRMA